MKKTNAVLVMLALIVFTGFSWMSVAKSQVDEANAYATYLQKAEKYEEKEIYVDALTSYKSALELDSGNYNLIMKVAEMYYKLGDTNGYIQYCKNAIQVEPTNAEPYLKLADYYISRNSYSDSKAVLSMALEYISDNDEINGLLEEMKYKVTEKYISYEKICDWHIMGQTNVLSASKDGKWGIISKNGKKIIDFAYDYIGIYDIEAKVLPCLYEGEYFYINSSGYKKLVGDHAYDYLGSFGNGLAPAAYNGQYGYIDTEFHEMHFEFQYAGAFANGIAAVQKDDKWALIDKEFNYITEFEFDEILMDSYDFCSMFNVIVARKGENYYLIDYEGKQIGDRAYEGASLPAANGSYIAVKDGEKWGFTDAKTGEIVIAATYDEAKSFSLGMAPVKQEDRWGYIKVDGTFAVEPKYFEAGVFSTDGAAKVKSSTSWNILVLCEYDE